MRYAVTFTNGSEKREIVVELTAEEERDCAWQAAIHGCAEWPALENRYAAMRAAVLVPAEFAWHVPVVARINVH